MGAAGGMAAQGGELVEVARRPEAAPAASVAGKRPDPGTDHFDRQRREPAPAGEPAAGRNRPT